MHEDWHESVAKAIVKKLNQLDGRERSLKKWSVSVMSLM